MKLYVLEKYEKNNDGDYLKRVEVYKSKPSKFSYIIWKEQ